MGSVGLECCVFHERLDDLDWGLRARYQRYIYLLAYARFIVGR
jgi:hypothetical protein